MWSWEQFDGHDRMPIVTLHLEASWLPIWCWISPNRWAIGPRLNRDREPRSWFNFNRCRPIFAICLRKLHVIFWHCLSDGDRMLQSVPRVFKVRGRSRIIVAIWWRSRNPEPSSVRRRSDRQDWSDFSVSGWCTMITLWWKLDTSDSSTCHQVSPLIAFTYALLPVHGYLMIAWTRVHVISAILTTSTPAVLHRSLQKKNVWEQSPTQKK